jgi:hypothetical protein
MGPMRKRLQECYGFLGRAGEREFGPARENGPSNSATLFFLLSFVLSFQSYFKFKLMFLIFKFLSV